MSAFSACEEIVHRRDPDRYFSALFAPAGKRPFLFALYAFNYELARVAETAREPMLADIRLAWWREAVEGARAGKPRDHPVVQALAETLAANNLPAAWFERLIEARAFDASADTFADMAALEAYADATSGNLMRLAARVLSAEADGPARQAGIAYALAGLLRSIPFHAARDKRFLPDGLLGDARRRTRHHLTAARKIAMPAEALPAFLPAALVPLYLKRSDPPLWRKQIALLWAAIRGGI
ncbi:MAG: squalene/phytoene synthase family protein [Alphaproteobacteria bacterium]|nr:squalene/phytoene synthase family protein [Alphaproteobacteria bacterium]